MRALVVEDEKDIASDIGRALTTSGFIVDFSDDGEDAWFKGSTENYTVIILDMGLPTMDGLTVLKNWRKENLATPVIILTARGNWTDRVDGIDSGADDYLAKPFHMEELLARTKALVRRSNGVSQSVITIGNTKFDSKTNTVTRQGIKVELGPLEFRLFSHLLMNRPRAVSQTELSDAIYGLHSEPGSNAVEVLVGRLRKKLGTGLIETRRGYGYYVRDEPDAKESAA
jgi:two-component system, OmpR family, response regulator